MTDPTDAVPNPNIDPRVRIIDLRSRVLAGEELTKEEITSALRALTANRKQATTAVSARAAKKAAPALPLDLKDLFA